MAIELKKLEKISKALGDANRLRILNHIAANGGIGQCAAIQGCVELAQPSISHHIKILIEADLIETEKEGRHYRYILKQDMLNDYLNGIAAQVLPAKGITQQGVSSSQPPEVPSPIVVSPAETAAEASSGREKPGKVTHG